MPFVQSSDTSAMQMQLHQILSLLLFCLGIFNCFWRKSTEIKSHKIEWFNLTLLLLFYLQIISIKYYKDSKVRVGWHSILVPRYRLKEMICSKCTVFINLTSLEMFERKLSNFFLIIQKQNGNLFEETNWRHPLPFLGISYFTNAFSTLLKITLAVYCTSVMSHMSIIKERKK